LARPLEDRAGSPARQTGSRARVLVRLLEMLLLHGFIKKRGRQIPQKRGEAKETSWIRLGEKGFSLILICFMFLLGLMFYICFWPKYGQIISANFDDYYFFEKCQTIATHGYIWILVDSPMTSLAAIWGRDAVHFRSRMRSRVCL
jgi:hypothetical protein